MGSNIQVREVPHMVKNSRASRIQQTGRGILGYIRQGRMRAYITSSSYFELESTCERKYTHVRQEKSEM